jgi:cell division protease FtsH
MSSPRDSGPPPRQRRRPEPMPGGWLWVIVLLLFAGVLWVLLGSTGPTSIPYTDFIDLAQKQAFKQVVIRGVSRVVGEFKEGELEKLPENLKKYERNKRVEANINEKLLPQLTEALKKDDGKYVAPITATEEAGAWVGPFFVYVLPMLLFIGIFVFFILPRFRDPLSGGFLSSYIKSPARRYDKSKMRVTFQDVADMQYAKGELQEIVEFLKNPEKFQRLGAQIPKGVLLVGPPGTGKTLLARAVAGEAGVPFFSISGSEFIQMFVGVGASRVRDMFRTAKENAPCLLFIDEIDAVGRMRGAGVGGGSDEREQTLNQILSEMDGFTPAESVIVLAATNRPDVLDSALLRPGRFDRHITIDRPNWRGRLEILKVHTRNKPLADNVNLETIARAMIGMTGADLRNLANEAALIATRENKPRIDRHDFDRAADRVLRGAKREEILNEDDKRRTAYHEAGHGVVAWTIPEADKPMKISIIPRGQTGGINLIPPDEDRHHHGRDYFEAQLAVLMGGRAVERLIYGQPYAGVEMDLKQATRWARYMVTHWGMSERLGPMSFRIGEEHVFLGKEIQEARDFSDQTAYIIDQEVQKLLREADERAHRILDENRDKVELLVEALMQREELNREELEEILTHNRMPPSNGSPDSDATTAAELPQPNVVA